MTSSDTGMIRTVEGRVRPGETYKGTIKFGTGNAGAVRGTVSTDDPRIHPAHRSLSKQAGKADFTVNTKGLKEGDVFKGEILLVTKEGEIKVGVRLLISSFEEPLPVSDPAQFTELYHA